MVRIQTIDNNVRYIGFYNQTEDRRSMFDIEQKGQLFMGLAVTSAVKILTAYLMRQKRHEKFERVGTVKELIVYPFKSCRGIYVNEALCTKYGLKINGVWDRRWMVVRPNGRFLSQRQQPKMALVSVSICEDHVVLEAPSMKPFKVEKTKVFDRAKVMACSIWDGNMDGLDCGDEIAQWFSDFLEMPGIRVVFFSDDLPTRNFNREVKAWDTNAVDDDASTYGDWGSYLFLTESSLAALNRELTKKVTMKSFRPNFVIDGSPEFDEDNWQEIKIGDQVHMRCLDACTRCVLTTVDPDTGVRNEDGEPLKTLKRIRCKPPYGISPIFGVNTAPDVCGDIRVGDPIYAIKGPRV